MYVIHNGRFIKVPSDLFFADSSKLNGKVIGIIKKNCLRQKSKVSPEVDKDLAKKKQELWEYIKDDELIKFYTREKLPVFNNEVLKKIEEWIGEKHYSLLRGKRGLYYPHWLNPIFLFNNNKLILKPPYRKSLEDIIFLHRSQIRFFRIDNYYKEVKHTTAHYSRTTGTYYTTSYKTIYTDSDLVINGNIRIRNIHFDNFLKWLMAVLP